MRWRNRRKVFLAHGRWYEAVDAMKVFLGSLGVEVVDWDAARLRARREGRHATDILDAGFRMSYATVVFFSPDDVAALHPALAEAPLSRPPPGGGEPEEAEAGQQLLAPSNVLTPRATLDQIVPPDSTVRQSPSVPRAQMIFRRRVWPQSLRAYPVLVIVPAVCQTTTQEGALPAGTAAWAGRAGARAQQARARPVRARRTGWILPAANSDSTISNRLTT